MWTAATSGGGVKQLAVSKDGATVWVGGDFDNIGGQARNKLAAVHGDGSVDPGFNPGPATGPSSRRSRCRRTTPGSTSAAPSTG